MLQNIMKVAADNGTKQFSVLEQVTNNIANLNTPGYKVRRFDQYMMPDGRLEGVQRTYGRLPERPGGRGWRPGRCQRVLR